MKSMFKNSYLKQDIFDMERNEKVRDCLFKLYILMLTNEDDINYEKRINEFKSLYQSLNEQEQENVKNEYINIMNTQSENSKVKKKGMINYE